MDLYLIKICMYLLIALVYIFNKALYPNTYTLLGVLYIAVFILSLLLYKKKNKKY